MLYKDIQSTMDVPRMLKESGKSSPRASAPPGGGQIIKSREYRSKTRVNHNTSTRHFSNSSASNVKTNTMYYPP